MLHPIVELASQKYYLGSHIGQPLVSDKSSSEEEKVFKQLADELVRDIKTYPHAFVLACLMDVGVDADVAWTIPYRVKSELQTFDIDELCRLNELDYASMFSGDKKWHRYPGNKAKVFHQAVRKIVETKFMDGDASRIWLGKPDSYVVVQRFLDFHGCGFKIANMAPNLLCRYFGIEFASYRDINIAPDVHTRRVFQRLGLTPYVVDEQVSAVYTIAKARELCPDFPGIVDGMCWDVGRTFCSPTAPKCSDCPFSCFCLKDIKNKPEVWE